MKNIFSHTYLVQKYFNVNVPKEQLSSSENPQEKLEVIQQERIVDLKRILELRLKEKLTQEEREELSNLTKKHEAQNKDVYSIIQEAEQQAQASTDKLKQAVENSSVSETPEGKQQIENMKEEQRELGQNYEYNKANVLKAQGENNNSTPVTQTNVGKALDNFEKTKNNTIIARLFGLEDNFFKGSLGSSIKSQSSLSSMLIAVKYAVETGNIPSNRKGWEAIGYNVQGIIMQKGELNRLVNFAQHVQSHPEHLRTIDYIVSFANNNRDGYIRTTHDIYGNRLKDMAGGGVQVLNQGADGTLEARSDTIISALVGVEDKNYASVRIVDLQAALTRAVKQGHAIENIYKRITGQDLVKETGHDLINARLQFRDALEVHLSLMKAAGGANAGLDALLQGKSGEYLEAVRKHLENGGKIEVQSLTKNGLSNKQLNILNCIATTIGAVVTGGILTLNMRQGKEVTAEDIMNTLNANPSIRGKFGNVLGAIGNFFLGRNFKLSIGQDDFLKAFENRILSQASDVMKISFNTDPKTITNPELKNAFEIAKNNGYVKSEADMKIFQKAIIEHIINSEARGVSDQKAIWASINPVFFGIHYDRVKTNKVDTRASDANRIEGEVTADKMDVSKMEGIKIDKEGKIFTIDRVLPDYTGSSNGKFEVVTMGANGEFVPLATTEIKHNTPKNMHLTLVMNQGKGVYVLSFTDRPVNTTKPAEVSVSKNESPAMEAKVARMFEARDALREKTRANIGDSIYIMTRKRTYENFNNAMAKVGEQDYEGAISLLANGKTNTEKALYNAFKENPEGLATALTFKYGSINKNLQGNATARQYAAAHSDGVTNAENNLTQYNKTSKETEGKFRNHSLHKPTELSTLLEGQNLAVSVYATPKGGTHRIDKFSGSIQVSNHIEAINNADAKREIFNRHKVDNQKNLDSINKYLGKGKEITEKQFEEWMVNGTLPNGITEGMVVKQPQFIEARAMIQGNLCANKTEAIAYPLLKQQPKPEVPSVDNNVVSLGETTVLTEKNTNQIHTDVGGNPIVVAENLNPDKPNTPTEGHSGDTTPRQGRTPDNLSSTHPAGTPQKQVSQVPTDGVVNSTGEFAANMPQR